MSQPWLSNLWKQASAKYKYDLELQCFASCDLEDWAWQRGRFATGLSQATNTAGFEGGIRLLFVQPQSGFKQTIPEALTAGSILEALKLPSSTFVSFQLAGGTYSMHTLPEGSHPDDCEAMSALFSLQFEMFVMLMTM